MQSVIIDFSKLGNLRDFWSAIKLDSGLEKVLSSLRSSGEEREVFVQS